MQCIPLKKVLKIRYVHKLLTMNILVLKVNHIKQNSNMQLYQKQHNTFCFISLSC